MDTDLDKVLARTTEISARINTLQAEIALCRAEQEENEITIRVLRRLHGDSPTEDTAIESALNFETMTWPALIKMSLAKMIGPQMKSATPNQVKEYIAEHWRPEVKPGDIGPVMWRMWKTKKLGKNGDGYFPLKESAPVGAGKPKPDQQVSASPGDSGTVKGTSITDRRLNDHQTALSLAH